MDGTELPGGSTFRKYKMLTCKHFVFAIIHICPDMKDWPNKHDVLGAPPGHLQGQTNNTYNTRFHNTVM